jgi:thiamine-phosphate pyrophosphorylase
VKNPFFGGKAAVHVDFNIYLITDRLLTRGIPLSSVVEQALKGGVRAVQIREKDLPTDDLFALAKDIRRLTFQYGAKLLINGRADIARNVHADGVHLAERGSSVESSRNIIGPGKLIGVSCHSLDSATLAQEAGADFVTFGPIFSTPSKTAYGKPVGLELLSETVTALDIPVFGLGGINESNFLQVMAAGARGVALISAIMASADPRAAAELLLKKLNYQRLTNQNDIG